MALFPNIYGQPKLRHGSRSKSAHGPSMWSYSVTEILIVSWDSLSEELGVDR